MVNPNQVIRDTTRARLRRILEEKIRRSQPSFKRIYDGARQRPVLEIKTNSRANRFPLAGGEIQTDSVDF